MGPKLKIYDIIFDWVELFSKLPIIGRFFHPRVHPCIIQHNRTTAMAKFGIRNRGLNFNANLTAQNSQRPRPTRVSRASLAIQDLSAEPNYE